MSHQYLKPGEKYSLSSNEKSNTGKSFIFVKLTDASLQSIEKLQNTDPGSNIQPTIQFINNSGFLNFPQNGSVEQFSFGLSNLDAELPQGSFECVSEDGNKSLKSLGCMYTKMQINAREDSYKSAKVKLVAADEQQKKSRTKEIKVQSTQVGRISKSTGRSVFAPPQKPELSAHRKNAPQRTSKRIFGERQSFPLRKRIIHWLALKPHKRPELLVKLITEGISDADKAEYSKVLSEVAEENDKKLYNLADWSWGELQEDWPFYSEDERDIVLKKRNRYCDVKPDINKLAAMLALKEASSKSPPVPKFHNEVEIPAPIVQQPTAKKKVLKRTRNKNGSGPPNKFQKTQFTSGGLLHETSSALASNNTGANHQSTVGKNQQGSQLPLVSTKKGHRMKTDGMPQNNHNAASDTDAEPRTVLGLIDYLKAESKSGLDSPRSNLPPGQVDYRSAIPKQAPASGNTTRPTQVQGPAKAASHTMTSSAQKSSTPSATYIPKDHLRKFAMNKDKFSPQLPGLSEVPRSPMIVSPASDSGFESNASCSPKAAFASCLEESNVEKSGSKSGRISSVGEVVGRQAQEGMKVKKRKHQNQSCSVEGFVVDEDMTPKVNNVHEQGKNVSKGLPDAKNHMPVSSSGSVPFHMLEIDKKRELMSNYEGEVHMKMHHAKAILSIKSLHSVLKKLPENLNLDEIPEVCSSLSKIRDSLTNKMPSINSPGVSSSIKESDPKNS